MFDFGLAKIVVLLVSAFLCEYVDSTLGMGYGTTLTPIFLLIGFKPLEIVPAILISEFLTGITAGIFHQREGNVNFRLKSPDIFKISKMLSPLGYIETLKKSMPEHLKVAILLSLCSILGTIAAVFVAVNIPKFWLQLYIGCLVLAMGIIILILFNKTFRFSWIRISILGIIASFNKGMSGGGYGPIITGGQILAGVEGKSAVGITSLAEGLTCLVGIITYVLVCKNPVDWPLATYISIGALLSVPLSAKSVKIISTKKLKLAIALLTIVLGLLTIIKTIKNA